MSDRLILQTDRHDVAEEFPYYIRHLFKTISIK